MSGKQTYYPDESKADRGMNNKSNKPMTSPNQGPVTPQSTYGSSSKEMSDLDENVKSPLLPRYGDDIQTLGLFKSPPPNAGTNQSPTTTTTTTTGGVTSPPPFALNIMPGPSSLATPSQRRNSVTITDSITSTIRSRHTNTTNTTHINDSNHAINITPTPHGWPSIKRMIKRMKPESGKISIGIIAMIGGSLATLLIPLAVSKLVDILNKEGAVLGDIRWIIIAACAAIIVNAVCTWLQLALLSIAGDRIVTQLRIDLFKSLIYSDISFFDTA